MNYKRKLFSGIALAVDARLTCKARGNTEWFEKHTTTIGDLVAEFLPSGSGWDCGTRIDLNSSTGERLVFFGSFHHMDENGSYDGWTEHTITVKGSLMHGLIIQVSGRNRNDIKEYLHEMFGLALQQDIDWNEAQKRWVAVVPDTV
jgi:hypothetical protein